MGSSSYANSQRMGTSNAQQIDLETIGRERYKKYQERENNDPRFADPSERLLHLRDHMEDFGNDNDPDFNRGADRAIEEFLEQVAEKANQDDMHKNAIIVDVDGVIIRIPTGNLKSDSSSNPNIADPFDPGEEDLECPGLIGISESAEAVRTRQRTVQRNKKFVDAAAI